MVLDYYKLREEPFGITPDSRYLFSSATHREALASLLYGVEAGRGFVALIAKPGMGKTTLLFQALRRLEEKARTVFLFQTICQPVDFLRALLTDLGVHETQGTLIELQAKLNDVLVQQSRAGKPLVVVIDEAQNLDGAVLELVRMLSNFETSREKLIQIILSGQPQLAEKLASPELVQLRQRISIVACLKPLSPEETALYIEHRMRAAGYCARAPLFTPAALALIAQSSEGIPRNINNLCFNALSLGCAVQKSTIDCDIVREVVADLDLQPLRQRSLLAPGPEKIEARATPAWFAAARTRPALAGWFPKTAIAGAIALALAGALFASPRFQSAQSRDAHFPHEPPATPEAVVLADQVIPPLVTAAPPVVGGDATQPPAAAASMVRVTAGKTLYRICVENFGRCSPARLQQIQRLNPWLNDLSHIEAGQTVRVPFVRNPSGTTRSIAEPDDSASPAERGTP